MLLIIKNKLIYRLSDARRSGGRLEARKNIFTLRLELEWSMQGTDIGLE